MDKRANLLQDLINTDSNASSSAGSTGNSGSPQPGQSFFVKRSENDEYLPAEVLETRVVEHNKEKKTEYFVHFENCKLILF